ncbi:hypothetical protein [Devosia sp.]|uniref:hypothetical protein n=1 Tax=Devosia sp. TaxID=1871048 RepID=UPI003A8DAC08
MTPPLIPETARAHEALTPRVTALLKQVERAAAKTPEAPIPVATRDVAQVLFREARKILGREVKRWAGRAFGSLGGLSVGLGQLAAGLEAFEAAHLGYSQKAKCVVWHVAGPVLPVTRLKPPGVATGPGAAADDKASAARQQLTRLVMARYAAGYDQGYRHAKEGLPPAAEYAERVWNSLLRHGGDDKATRKRELKRLYGTATPPSHLMPIGSEPGEWQRIQRARWEARKAALSANEAEAGAGD